MIIFKVTIYYLDLASNYSIVTNKTNIKTKKNKNGFVWNCLPETQLSLLLREAVVEPRDLYVTWYIDAMPILLQGGCFQWVVGCPCVINSIFYKVSTAFKLSYKYLYNCLSSFLIRLLPNIRLKYVRKFVG